MRAVPVPAGASSARKEGNRQGICPWQQTCKPTTSLPGDRRGIWHEKHLNFSCSAGSAYTTPGFAAGGAADPHRYTGQGSVRWPEKAGHVDAGIGRPFVMLACQSSSFVLASTP